MVDRPILFSAPMVRALLAGDKTQTRRLATSPLRRVAVGDRLWVRETWACYWATDDQKPRDIDPSLWSVRYLADDCIRPATKDGSKALLHQCKRARVAIHMPRWASRLTLIVTATRTEPLQWITEADARAEGIERVQMEPGISHFRAPGSDSFAFATFAYADLWNGLHKKPGERWEDNPDVIALTFTVDQRNIDG